MSALFLQVNLKQLRTKVLGCFLFVLFMVLMIVYNFNKLYTKIKFCDIMLQNRESQVIILVIVGEYHGISSKTD